MLTAPNVRKQSHQLGYYMPIYNKECSTVCENDTKSLMVQLAKQIKLRVFEINTNYHNMYNLLLLCREIVIWVQLMSSMDMTNLRSKWETFEIFLNTVCAKDYRRPKAKDL